MDDQFSATVKELWGDEQRWLLGHTSPRGCSVCCHEILCVSCELYISASWRTLVAVKCSVLRTENLYNVK